MTNVKHFCEGNSAVECKLPKLDVAGSTPVPRLITMNKKHFFITFSGLLIIVYCSTGCVTVTPTEQKLTVYHKVRKGQTLWQISKIYNVDLDAIVKANNITDVAQIQAAQAIFIPKTPARITKTEPALKRNKTPTTNFTSKNSEDNFIWPARGKILNKFGEKNANIINKGIDLRAATADILASRSGRIAFAAQELAGYGKIIIMEHPGNFMTVYAYLSEILVSPGQYITQGTPIAKIIVSASEQKNILHFEIRKEYHPQNPQYYLSAL